LPPNHLNHKEAVAEKTKRTIYKSQRERDGEGEGEREREREKVVLYSRNDGSTNVMRSM